MRIQFDPCMKVYFIIAFLVANLIFAKAGKYVFDEDSITIGLAFGHDTLHFPKKVYLKGALYLDPGQVIVFDSAAKIYGNGFIHAQGTKNKPIKFTCSDTTKRWEGIRLIGPENHTQVTYFKKRNIEKTDILNNGRHIIDLSNLKEGLYYIHSKEKSYSIVKCP